MLCHYFEKNKYANRIFMPVFQFNQYGLTTKKFSTEIVWTLSKRNCFSIGRCAKYLRCLTVTSHPE